MKPKIKLVNDQGREEVKGLLAGEEQTGLPKARLMAVRLAFTGQHSLEEIADLTGMARSRVIEWIKRFRAEGVEGLKSKPRGGAKAARTQVTQEAEAGLRKGLKEGRWKRAEEIQNWAKTQGVSLSRPGVYGWLRRVKAKLKMPRKSHAKKDPVKAEAFKLELDVRLAKLGLPKGTKVRVWVADEHRYGLISVLRRVWTLRGHRPTAPYRTRYQWGYLYSALEVAGDGLAEAMFADGVSLGMSHAFLRQLSARDADAVHVVIWDQAGFHQNTETPLEELPSNIRILSLPPYSPELNPVEKIGDLIKDRIGNILYDTLPDIEPAISEKLRPIWHGPERVRSLIGDGWLLSKTNSSSKPYRPVLI
jgi:transposase